ncbi:MAG: phage tail protein [Defluviitaleaceae bacterium]|nr:phage tail protein [Defluviitaleaceae bacterium]
MATIGLRDLFYAPITELPDGKEQFGKPVRMAKAIQAQMSTQIAEAKLFADDSVDESVKEFVSGSLTLNINDLQPTYQAYLLGQKMDADGVIYAGDGDEAPYVAIGFRATKTRGRFKYIWLYKVKFAIPDENYQTKGESIEFQTPSIVGTYQKRNDGKWKADFVGLATEAAALSWFDEVREYSEAITDPPTPPDPLDP